VPSVSSVSSANKVKKRKRGLEDADYDRIEPANPYEKRYRKSVRHVGARTAAGVAARTSVRTGGGDDRDREGRAILRRRVGGAGPGTCRTSDSLRGRGQPADGRKGLTKYASTPLSPTHNRQGGKYARNVFGAGFRTRAHCVNDRGCRDRDPHWASSEAGGPDGKGSRHRKSVLTSQQRTWASDSESRWMGKYAQLQAFKHQHKHVHVPTIHSGLGAWVKNQREKARDCTLRPERKQMLSELGFCFDGVEASRLRRQHPREKESMRVVRGGLPAADEKGDAASAVQEGSHTDQYQPWPGTTSPKPGPSSLPKDPKSCTRLSESFEFERGSEAGSSKGQEGGGAAAGESLMREGLLSFAPRPHPPLSDPRPPLSDANQASKHRPILVAKKTVTYLYNFIALPATTTRTLNHN
jgi:hypothetical protein